MASFLKRLSRADIAFSFAVPFIAIPTGGAIIFSHWLRNRLEPQFVEARAKWERVEPDVWLFLEGFSGREGLYSERMRRNLARKEGVEYVPRVLTQSPFELSPEERLASSDAAAPALALPGAAKSPLSGYRGGLDISSMGAGKRLD